MKLRQLFEEPRTAVMAFGRMNPPTIGHAKLVDAIKSQQGDHYLFLSQSQKPKTDPLAFADKLRYAKFFFPEVTIGHPEVKTIIQALKKISDMGYENLIYVAGSDRVQAFDELINKYNGGDDYSFKSIKVVSAGERDPDADGAEGMSASKMRAAASEGDFDSFKQGVPNQEIADEMYNAVRKGMGITEPEMAEDVSPEDEDKFHNELDDLVHKYFGDSPDEEKMKKKMDRIKESDVVINPVQLRSYLRMLIDDAIDKETDIEKLSKVLKILVGKEIRSRGRSYAITSEDVLTAFEASCKNRRKKKMSENANADQMLKDFAKNYWDYKIWSDQSDSSAAMVDTNRQSNNKMKQLLDKQLQKAKQLEKQLIQMGMGDKVEAIKNQRPAEIDMSKISKDI